MSLSAQGVAASRLSSMAGAVRAAMRMSGQAVGMASRLLRLPALLRTMDRALQMLGLNGARIAQLGMTSETRVMAVLLESFAIFANLGSSLSNLKNVMKDFLRRHGAGPQGPQNEENDNENENENEDENNHNQNEREKKNTKNSIGEALFLAETSCCLLIGPRQCSHAFHQQLETPKSIEKLSCRQGHQTVWLIARARPMSTVLCC